ncbi:MAG: hypothetical protein JXQ83_03580 [Candidatus Glassbacteria bacterium]|nr:hypothetical protein [Candidatus Glassbacteria bacterium]
MRFKKIFIVLLSLLVVGCKDQDSNTVSSPVLSSSDVISENIEIELCPEFQLFMQSMPTPISVDTIIGIVEPWDGVSEFESGKAYSLTLEQAKRVLADDQEILESLEKVEEIRKAKREISSVKESREIVFKSLIFTYDPADFPENNDAELSSTTYCAYGLWASQEHYCDEEWGILKYYWWTHQPAWPSDGRKSHWHYGMDPEGGPAIARYFYNYDNNAKTVYSMADPYCGIYYVCQNCYARVPQDTLGQGPVVCYHGNDCFYCKCP